MSRKLISLSYDQALKFKSSNKRIMMAVKKSIDTKPISIIIDYELRKITPFYSTRSQGNGKE